MTSRALRGAAGWGTAIVVLAGLPHVLPVYHQFVASLTLVNAVAAMGVNLSMGYGGQVSIGHAGFVAIGAYTAAVLMTKLGVTYWLTLPLGGALAALAGFLIGLPALRLSHLYIGMVTFGFGQAIGFVALNWVALTNGPNGIAVPPVMVGAFMFTPDTFYYVIAAVFLALFWIARNLVTSRVGRSFLALRESETAAEAMGVNLVQYKTMAFAVGAAYGGVAGSLYAGLSQFVNPDAFVFLVSVLYLTMNVVGGMGTLAGPVLGAVIFTVMPELLRAFAEYKEFLSGALLLGFLVFFPRGLVGILGPAWMRLARRFPRRARPLPARSSVVDEA
jgi:ABC-type branched-subunit amino acid transport system permease subunit